MAAGGGVVGCGAGATEAAVTLMASFWPKEQC